MAFVAPIDQQNIPRKEDTYTYKRGPRGDVYVERIPGETDEQYAQRLEAEGQAIEDVKTQKAINWERVGIPNMYQTPTSADVVAKAQKDAKGLPALPTAPMQKTEMNTRELDDLRKMLGEYEKKGNKMDWSPLLALTDAWTGSNLAASYDRPMTKVERDKLVMGLKSRIYDAQARMKQGQDDLAFKLKKWNEEREDKRTGRLVELEKARMYSGGNRAKQEGFDARNKMSQSKNLMNMYKDTYADMISTALNTDPDDQKVKAKIPEFHMAASQMANRAAQEYPDRPYDELYGSAMREIRRDPNLFQQVMGM